MAKTAEWILDEGDSCPKCGGKIEVLLEEGKDNKFDTEEGISFPKAERCRECGWRHQLEKSED